MPHIASPARSPWDVRNTASLGISDSASSFRHATGSSIDTFERTNASRSAASSSYGINTTEHQALAQNDLRGFWLSRLGKDPIARIGISFWGNDQDLRNAINQSDSADWQPKFNWLTTMYLRMTVPSSVTIPPKTKDDLFSYWRYMGNEATSRLQSAIKTSAARNGESLSSQEVSNRYRAVGTSLAHAHAEAVTNDEAQSIGITPGLLNPTQVANYHQSVFRDAGLPKSAYGGTPYWFVPDFLEIALTSGLYGEGTTQA